MWDTVESYNQQQQQIVEKNNNCCYYIDINKNIQNNLNFFTFDGIHLTQSGYDAVVVVVKPFLEEIWKNINTNSNNV